MSRKNDGSRFIVGIIIVGFFVMIAVLIMDEITPKCGKEGCKNEQVSGSIYCYVHELFSESSSHQSKSSGHNSDSLGSSSSSSKGRSFSGLESSGTIRSSKEKLSTNSYSSYDEGYDAIYDDDDYDWDRYYSDDDYADGVDDAMDELDW